jgi:drug/metabolite transporter (DMT)-like permease
VSSRSSLRITLCFLAVYLIWGSTYLAIRFAIETLPPFIMAGTRYLAAGAVLFAWGLRDGARPTLHHWREVLLLGALFFLGGNGAVVWAEQRIPSGIASLLIATMPLWVVVLDWLRPGGTRPHPLVAAGVVLGFSGLLLLMSRSEADSTSIDMAGAVVLVGGAFSWAIGSLYALHADLPRSLPLASGMEMLAGGVLLTLTGLAGGELGAFRVDAISARSVLAFAYLVVFGSIVAFSAFRYLVDVAPPSRVSTYAYVNPVVAVVLGWLLAGESISARTLAGAAVIVGAVAMVTAGVSARTSRELVPAPVAELAEEPPPS